MTPETPPPLLIAMLKAPQAGRVKTRLAIQVGASPAVLIYRQLVEHQLTAVPSDWRVEVHFSPADAEQEMRQWLGPEHGYFAQSGEDLGERLVNATVAAFNRTNGPVIIIGGDCPSLDETLLRRANCLLAGADVAIGPTADGGYYLIGLRRSAPSLFSAIPWSSAAVFQTTVARVRAAGLSLATLPEKEDVDDLASWQRQQHLLRPFSSPDHGRD